MEKQQDLVSEWGSKWAPETRCTDVFCFSSRCVKKGTSGEATAVDAGLCDQEEMPSRAQVCFLACPKDCVPSAWGPWSSCSLVRRKNALFPPVMARGWRLILMYQSGFVYIQSVIHLVRSYLRLVALFLILFISSFFFFILKTRDLKSNNVLLNFLHWNLWTSLHSD